MCVEDQSSPAELASRLEKCWARFGVVGIADPITIQSTTCISSIPGWRGMRGIRRLCRSMRTPGILTGDVLARQALGLRRDQLDFDAWRKARDTNEGEWGESVSTSAIAFVAERREPRLPQDRTSRSLYSPGAWLVALSSG